MFSPLKHKSIVLATLLCFISHLSWAEENLPTSINVPHITQSPIILDGNLTEDAWKNARLVNLNLVNDPWDNQPSPVKTTAKLFDDGEYLYIAFIAQDPNPENIIASLGDRDTRWLDDLVGLKLDTANNRRLNYNFFVNPYGVQQDSIKNEMTDETNTSWDGIWDARGKITAEGFQVEIAIPFRLLNFDDSIELKTWAIELVRFYPRDTRLRISHLPIDKDNACWLCQAPEINGFKKAKASNNLMLTPALVVSKEQEKDIYIPGDDWDGDNSVETSLDLRWSLDANTTLNATMNPDFSTVESDSGQLSVNETFSLFYEEKRPFFLENDDYFTSNFDLVYTRNIADPDYGAKLTGQSGKHTYAAFVSNDTETNFIVPGNTTSSIASLNEESHSAAFKYRYDINDDFSIGAINTFRTSDDYHNIVTGLDSKYRFDNSNTLYTQVLTSNTEYPLDLYQDFCLDDVNNCQTSTLSSCDYISCGRTESLLRTKYDDELTDQAYKVSFEHESKYWQFDIAHQEIGKEFRADLGFMPYTDYKESSLELERIFYSELGSLWQEAYISSKWDIKHNENNELLERSLSSTVGIDGPMLSYAEFTYTYANKVGLRYNKASLDIDNNTSRFNEKYSEIYSEIQLTTALNSNLNIIYGDQVDYVNDRLGDYIEIESSTRYNVTHNSEVEFIYTHAQMDADSHYVYRADIAEMRLSYQFNLHSYLKLNIVYRDVQRNQNNNPDYMTSEVQRNLSTQLIYAYTLNPQTVFFLGYSDQSYQDDALADLEREQRTFFSKISYAWMP